MRKLPLVIIILTILLIPAAMAAPPAPAIADIGSNNATFSSVCAGICWFRWGMNTDIPEWKTPNQTIAGAYTQKVTGVPYLPTTVYYVKACDTTGCSAASTFTSIATTPIPQTTFGRTFDNVTEMNFDAMHVVTVLFTPMTWAFPNSLVSFGISLVSGILIGFYFLGLWLRTRNIKLPTILGIITATFFLSANAGFGWGIPGEFAAIAQGLLYISITGLIMSLLKKG